MEKYVRHLKHMSRHTHGGDYSRPLKRFKKIIIGAVIAAVVVVIIIIILAVILLGWLFDRSGDQVSQAGKNLTEQIQSLPAPTLDLQNYITNGQVDTQKLEQTYNALPGPIQALWLDQLNAQINELKSQAGISDETIRALTTLYEALRQAQGQ